MDLPRKFEIATDSSRGQSYYIVDLDKETLFWSDRNGRSSASGATSWSRYSEERIAKYIEQGIWEIVEILEPRACVEVGDLL